MKKLMIALMALTSLSVLADDVSCEPASCEGINFYPASNCSRTVFCEAVEKFCAQVPLLSEEIYPFEPKKVTINCNMESHFSGSGAESMITIGTNNKASAYEGYMKSGGLILDGRSYLISDSLEFTQLLNIRNKIKNLVITLGENGLKINLPGTIKVSNTDYQINFFSYSIVSTTVEKNKLESLLLSNGMTESETGRYYRTSGAVNVEELLDIKERVNKFIEKIEVAGFTHRIPVNIYPCDSQSCTSIGVGYVKLFKDITDSGLESTLLALGIQEDSTNLNYSSNGASLEQVLETRKRIKATVIELENEGYSINLPQKLIIKESIDNYYSTKFARIYWDTTNSELKKLLLLYKE